MNANVAHLTQNQIFQRLYDFLVGEPTQEQFVSRYGAAIRALVQQSQPSVNDDGDCQYRGPDGSKCAIGHLIPDDMYAQLNLRKNIEGETVWSITAYVPKPGDGITRCDLLTQLQQSHDELYKIKPGPTFAQGFLSRIVRELTRKWRFQHECDGLVKACLDEAEAAQAEYYARMNLGTPPTWNPDAK